ncbi:hypothetical protein DFJ73DRAFT_834136 [Zopfochytrium polystomum]|nr:hypothetical protein DFJ73DRAFT_834136 [Zopfochytrium polystomum]
MAQFRYKGMWGHISLVLMQLSGYWELLDLADWDYVINLSAVDYPLRTSREIVRVLDLPETRGRLWIEAWVDHRELVDRTSRPRLIRHDPSHGDEVVTPKSQGPLAVPFPRWKFVKHHQWMTLTRDFVCFLRSSEKAALQLAHSEWTWIADESFVGIVAVNSAPFKDDMIFSSKRFVYFHELDPYHAAFVDERWISFIGEDGVRTVGNASMPTDTPRYLFLRKVNSQDGGARTISWARESHIARHLLPGGYEAYLSAAVAVEEEGRARTKKDDTEAKTMMMGVGYGKDPARRWKRVKGFDGLEYSAKGIRLWLDGTI